ncbi:nuclear transport factor 2 family protein [Solicola gregarius]|uniref:Nuclear transport factor 2 family protein n=1 Tax=Solicola gregarius TaxID=2908642 RepID=A0AA46YKX5_9ACTN|nr:nuclear transport factor 2 family protein [Solicola gregarius]UYM05937.1 nuclear transport factor 2 family protein [Solicola gregarius]
MPITVADRLAIHELISLHGHLADDGRPEGITDLMTVDGAYDVTDYGLGVVTGIDALVDLFRAAPGAQPRGHHVTNVIVTDLPGSDDSATVRSKGLSVMPDGSAGTVGYEDEVVRTSDGWRISRRTVVRR